MAKNTKNPLITALDIGTSKVVAIVAEQTEDGYLNIIGMGIQPCKGLRKGVIVNIDSTVGAIQKAIAEAEHMADCKIKSVSVGIAGAHIHSFNSNGIVAIRTQEVSTNDIERVVEAAKAVAIPADQRILHILPQEFLIDHQGGIKEPLGMSGVRLEAKVHIVSGSISAAQNIVKCVHACGLEVSDLVLEQLASSHSVLSEDEKDLGVCMVDIGAGTADVTVFTEGAIRHTAVMPIGGDQVTSDLAHALRVPTQYAEQVKIQHGVALSSLIENDESIEITGSGRRGQRFSLTELSAVAEARYEELFTLIYQDLQHSGFADQLAAGVVITGGASKMRGVLELADDVFRMPVRIGVPQNVMGMAEITSNPIHATGVGLLVHTCQQQEEGATSRLPVNDDELGMIKGMKKWFTKHL
jgi:cell division protein FtsA